MPRLKGSPEQRRTQKAAIREANRLKWGRDLASAASWSGHEMVRAACQVAKQTSHRLTEAGQRRLAAAIAQAVEAVNHPENRIK